MTVEKMRDKIDKECYKYYLCSDGCKLYEKFNCCPIEEFYNDEFTKEIYNIMFEKEESEMKNEFDLNELKAGMAIKTSDSNDLIIGVQMKNDIVFFNKDYVPIISKHTVVHNYGNENFTVLEIYGFSENNLKLFDSNYRPLL